MHIKQDGFSPAALILVVFVIGLVGFVYLRVIKADEQIEKSKISSFAECVAAGNPVMESYPEQCAANSQTFTNPVQQNPADSATSVFNEELYKKIQQETEAYLAANPTKLTNSYLNITKLGIKLPLTEATKSLAVYTEDAGENAVFIGPKSIEGSSCTVASIEKFKSGDRIMSDGGVDLGVVDDLYNSQQAGGSEYSFDFVKLDNNFYSLRHGNGGTSCFTEDLEGTKTYSIASRDIDVAFPLIVKL